MLVQTAVFVGSKLLFVGSVLVHFFDIKTHIKQPYEHNQ